MLQGCKTALSELQLEELQYDELQRQRQKQSQFEEEARKLWQDHNQRQQQKTAERNTLVLQNRMKREERDRLEAEDLAVLSEQQSQAELRIQQLDYDRRVFEKRRAEKEGALAAWANEQQQLRDVIDPEKRSLQSTLIGQALALREHKKYVQSLRHRLIQLEIEEARALSDM
eukprot:TRINITY_DN81613_c0_g1_i1.p1 TRINITY_DN81613_c0_g1~~TRINITY_DN81613_c0_g1_i1.p1  ORF type:complete len:172 (-),score=51.83 TRINITY_DN81613_c0_g1_i1:26-541(-)